MFIDNFQNICIKKGISMSRVLLDLEMGKSNITKWKSGIEPSNSTKKKIADYLDVSVSDLMPEKIKKPAEYKLDELDAETKFIVDVFKSVSPEAKQRILDYAQIHLELEQARKNQ